MSKWIVVTLEIEVPDEATDQDIQDWIDVEYGACNSMKMDNPCKNNYEVFSATWKQEAE